MRSISFFKWHMTSVVLWVKKDRTISCSFFTYSAEQISDRISTKNCNFQQRRFLVLTHLTQPYFFPKMTIFSPKFYIFRWKFSDKKFYNSQNLSRDGHRKIAPPPRHSAVVQPSQICNYCRLLMLQTIMVIREDWTMQQSLSVRHFLLLLFQ